uniref:RING finger protein 17 n=1 Tax=Sphenodon punctatus TaxID=8508 RepID=A0A8D0GWB4_SPHPU
MRRLAEPTDPRPTRMVSRQVGVPTTGVVGGPTADGPVRHQGKLATYHHALLCGHVYCELCFSVSKESGMVKCPDCEVSVYATDLSRQRLQLHGILFPIGDFTIFAKIYSLVFNYTIHILVSELFQDSRSLQEIDAGLRTADGNFERLKTAKKVELNKYISPSRYSFEESSRDAQTIHVLSMGEIPAYDTLCLENEKTEMLVKDYEAETLFLQELDVQLERETMQFQEVAAALPPKNITVVPHAMSSPDVIIEEIIGDDQEIFQTEHFKETNRRRPFQKMMMMPFGQRGGSPELVFVSHVINPCHFYVRKYSQKKTAVVLEKKLTLLCHSKDSYPSPSDALELGARILVNSKEKGMWCRGTVTELIPLKRKSEREPSGPTKYNIYDVGVMQVFLIDFGNSEVLIVSRIGDVPVVRPEHIALQHSLVKDLCSVIRKPNHHSEAELKTIHPLALQCALKGIVPPNSNEGWGDDARTEFLRMVKNKTVLMKVFKEEGGVLIVDLQKPPTNKITDDMPVSLRDALVFMELARFQTQLPSSPENMPLQYCPPVLPQEMTEISIVVCHVNCPSDFYLQLTDSLDFLVLLKKIEEIYKNEGEDNLEILCPVQGQACIAKFEDGVWYRAQVIGLSGHQEVQVRYVDFGNTAKITLKDMRKIKYEFLSTPEKAISSKLAYVEPCKGANEWSSKAKERFEELTHEKFMLCSVTGILQDNVLSVELFESPNLPEKLSSSINGQLVKEGLASYVTGQILEDSYQNNEVWDPSLAEILETETGETLNSKEIESLQNEDLGLLPNKELQVQISHVVSPNKIFVQLLSSENVLKSLQEKMDVTYEYSKMEPVQWENNMYCAVHTRDLKQWRRGQISKIVSENTVEVCLYDFGVKEMVNVTHLRKLEENLKTTKPLALECSLVDIRPTGGSDRWTATACDTISYYLTGAVANIIIQVCNTIWPLPVKVFCKNEVGLFVDISEYLIKKGLAFKKRRTHKIKTSDAVLEKPLEVSLEQECSPLNKLIPETECTPNCSVSETEDTLSPSVLTEHQLKQQVIVPRMEMAYKPPVIPSMDAFQAIVSCIGDDGTIYIIPKSQESALNKLMDDLQNKFKCLGLLDPYCWKKGEVCVVRGSDTMWYRGKVIEMVGGAIRVQYLDHGYVEKIPQCHLYPTMLYVDIPPFCIPCQLYSAVPIGNFWQEDAIGLLRELLTKRVVKMQIQKQPDDPWGKVLVDLYFDGMSLSFFMAHHKHCTVKELLESEAHLILVFVQGLLLPEVETSVLPPYTYPSLPVPGEHFPIKVKHLISPNEVYISFSPPEPLNQQSDTDSGVSCDSDIESMDQVLKHCNKNIASIPFLTDFRTEMPCLAEYNDGFWYRAKLIFIKEFDPLAIIVEFVDYGSTVKLPTSRLRQIPSQLMKYPAQTLKVLLSGFKPALYDAEKDRIHYCPEWSMEALWAMINCLEGKQLYASSLEDLGEVSVSTDEEASPLHKRPQQELETQPWGWGEIGGWEGG